MRRTVTLVWLDDKVNSPAISQYQDKVKRYIQNKGYVPEIVSCSTFDEANQYLLDHKHCDFFITDLKLGGKENGLTYRDQVRKSNGYRQFVLLYSNNTLEVIKKYIAQDVRSNTNTVLANFAFLSIRPQEVVDRDWENVVQAALCSWDELNALRGEVTCEHAEIEEELERIVGECGDYGDKIKEYKNRVLKKYRDRAEKKEIEEFFEKWFEMKNIRNACAHGLQKRPGKKGLFLRLSQRDGTYIDIYEQDIDEQRRKLVDFRNEVDRFVSKHKIQ